MIHDWDCEKILILRLSSFGDILQGLSVPSVLKRKFPKAKVHWVTRSDFSELLDKNPSIDKVWAFDKKQGLLGWFKLILQLRGERFTHVYDAHSNVRSHLLTFYFRLTYIFAPYVFTRRSKQRWKRFLLFRFRKNLFPKPFLSQFSFLEPIRHWVDDLSIPKESQLHFSEQTLSKVQALLPKQPFIAIAPSAAWQMKRWPVEYWKQLVSSQPSRFFVILGGPEDHFCEDIAAVAPDRCLNLAGQLRLIESCAAASLSQHIISGDTGLLHAADLLGHKTTALIGPTAFGFPSHPNQKVLFSNLSCQPCSKDGRGRCSQTVYQKCMVDISPKQVGDTLP